MKNINIPIWGYVTIPEAYLPIVESEEFQRLRRVKQLGFTYYVYPSATGNRYTHSLGVMDVATRICDSIDLDQKSKEENVIAGLCHDIGHLPFSHTLEPLMYDKMDLEHEDLSCEYVDKIFSDYDIDTVADKENIKRIIRGEYDGINVISNDIDADRIDYLKRDSYNVGIDYGSIESDSIIQFAENIDGELGFDFKAKRAIELLLDSRNRMNYSVYQHRTVEIIEHMFRSAVRHHIHETDTTMRDIISLDDEQMSVLLQNSESKKASSLYNKIINRNIYKTAYIRTFETLSVNEIKQVIERLDDMNKYKQEIIQETGLNDTDVFISGISLPEKESYDIPIQYSNNRIRRLNDVSTSPENLHKNIHKNQNIHVFGREECIDDIQKASEKILPEIDI